MWLDCIAYLQPELFEDNNYTSSTVFKKDFGDFFSCSRPNPYTHYMLYYTQCSEDISFLYHKWNRDMY